ncbi:MAG: HAD-IA family hydrolase, partial [Candidatus Kerfeldbacteria bacterium]|nr:HAD-IA family hydrolase [Candidatus Kerfeldbacteria bacterium]
PTGAELPSNTHMSMDATLRRVYPQATDDDIRKWIQLSDSVDVPSNLLRPIPGVLEVLPQLAAAYTLGLVTNRLKAHLGELWHIVPYEKDFTAIAAFEDTENHKPDPEPIHYALSKLGTTPSEAVFVGDAITDLQAGQAAGVDVIILGQESWPGAFATIENFSELPVVLARR